MVISQNRAINLQEILSYYLGNISFPLASTDGSLAKTRSYSTLESKAVLSMEKEKTKHYISVFMAVGKNFEIETETFVTVKKCVCELYGEKVSDINQARYNRFCKHH